MKKLIKIFSLCLLILGLSSCAEKPSDRVGRHPYSHMYDNTKGSVFHILNTNTDLKPLYYEKYTGQNRFSKDIYLYMEDNWDSGIILTTGTYVFFYDGNCLICNNK